MAEDEAGEIAGNEACRERPVVSAGNAMEIRPPQAVQSPYSGSAFDNAWGVAGQGGQPGEGRPRRGCPSPGC